MFCPDCRSEHEEDAYTCGWIIKNDFVVEVKGTCGETHAMAEKGYAGQIFWTKQAAEDYLAGLQPPEPEE